MWRDIPAILADSIADDFTRYLAAAGLMFGLCLLWRRLRVEGHKIRPTYPKAPQMGREFLASFRTTIVFAANTLMVLSLFELAGFSVLERAHAQLSPAGFVLSFVAMVLAHDAWFYWTHRMMHAPALYVRLHAFHHRSHNPSPWAAYAFSTLEALVEGSFLPAFMLLSPTSLQVFATFMTWQIAVNVVGHSGFEIYPRWLVLNPLGMAGVTHHDLHHATYRYNYGLYFRWWDRMMGTEHPQVEEIFRRV